MTEIYLVRHGQASMGQEDYDVLSPLGQTQAQWLAEYFAEHGLYFDHLYSGTLNRQIHTLEAICNTVFTDTGTRPETTQLPHFNEFDFMQVIRLFLAQNPHHRSESPSPKYWFKMLRHSMQAWSQNKLIADEATESWLQFTQRVEQGLTLCSYSPDQRVLISTSGGVIACAVGVALGLDADAIIRLNLQIQNSSVTRLIRGRDQWSLHSFNALPHMSNMSRADKITYA